jgi:hypothetical protein
MGSSTVSPRFEYRFMPYLASCGGHLAAKAWSPCVAYRVSAASKFSFAIRFLATPFFTYGSEKLRVHNTRLPALDKRVVI